MSTQAIASARYRGGMAVVRAPAAGVYARSVHRAAGGVRLLRLADATAFSPGQNFSLILQQVMVVGVLAIGQTLIILTAGIDLSCGMVMALGSIVMTKFAVDLGMNPYLAILCGLLVCVGLRLPERRADHLHPAAAVHRDAGHAQHRLRPHADLLAVADGRPACPMPLLFLGNTFKIGDTAITYGTVLMLVMYLVAWFVLRETAAGPARLRASATTPRPRG